ncbi:MAG: tyrosine-type recombinase/integrase [Prevotella sp.]|nr:tyrosine-type recombinase/integrase [Prevotella sp.]
MVNINYQLFGNKGFQLRLRLYKDGETKYINVTKMLVGDIQKKHWNARRQYFIPSCPFADQNNEIIFSFRRQVEEQAASWNGSLYGLMASMRSEKPKEKISMLDGLMSYVIDEKRKERHEDGTPKGTYENYVKLKKRLEEYCEYAHIKYKKLAISDITEDFINGMFLWIEDERGGKGAMYISKTLHATLQIASTMGCFDMKSVERCKWKKDKRVSEEKFKTLTDEQCERLKKMPLSELPRNPKSNIYRDFCVFLMCTGQSPCDAITLKKSDIKMVDGKEHIIFKRRKIAHKQDKPCAFPINDTMRKIINKWGKISSDGYIFPIRNKKKLASQKTDNGDIKHFNGRLNNWLKKVGVILGCDFELHTYTFRHTAITRYISKGVSTSYISEIMGTSEENCREIYYNSRADKQNRDLLLGVSL